MVNATKNVGDRIPIHQDAYSAFAWSETTTWEELEFIRDHLIDNQTVKLDQNDAWDSVTSNGKRRSFMYRPSIVTAAGLSRNSSQIFDISSSQAFVAMWIDDSMIDAFENGICLGIEDSGHKPLRIDQKPHANKIDEEIIAEIRRSRFVVADFTHGCDGARGSVYYEVGFAHGLGLDVIFSCRKDMVDNLHFDTRQYPHIIWESPCELRDRLRGRILALIGDGPGIDAKDT